MLPFSPKKRVRPDLRAHWLVCRSRARGGSHHSYFHVDARCHWSRRPSGICQSPVRRDGEPREPV